MRPGIHPPSQYPRLGLALSYTGSPVTIAREQHVPVRSPSALDASSRTDLCGTSLTTR